MTPFRRLCVGHHTRRFLHPDEDDYFLVGSYQPKQALMCRINRFDFMNTHWRNNLWHLPSQPETYRQEVYGEHSRTPGQYYDTVLSNPSRINAAMPPVLCYGYFRLFAALREAI